ncbi:MAG: thiamine pyrophosphate-dependent enzyme, partial [Acidovorax sp.]|uniref:thiamine pyrophosphate-dependent enzyme n=1 Tax=Acidovorax sp. TaxID=1872122 RepID=UPI0039E2823E
PAPRALPPARAPRPRVEPSAPMSVPFVMQALAEARSADSIVVEEAPSSRAAMQAHLPILQSETFYTMCSGGLGYGLPAAVGVALARPGRKVIGLVGDGSAMYSIQALWSAAQLALPITFIILKNRRYAALQEFAHTFGFREGDTLQGTDLPDLDFLALARGQGCDALRVSDAAQLPGALRQALAHPRALLLEVDVA